MLSEASYHNMTVGRIPSVEGGIQPTIVDAKGDLIAAVAADSLNRLAVGSNDQVLVADSAASTGLAWKSYGAQFVAGKNKIINGDFGVWQRGTSISVAAGGNVFTADRWQALITGTTCTASQQTFTPGTAPVSGYEGQFFHRIATGASTTYYELQQRIEDVRTFAGQTVTFSFWAKATNAHTATVYINQYFGVSGSPNVGTAGQNISLTTSWQRFTLNFTLGSMSGKTIGASSYINPFIYYASGTVANTSIDIWGVQLEAGSVATPFTTATGTIQGELAACQRYYYLHASGGDISIGLGTNTTASELHTHVQFPVTMRTTPTVDQATGTNYFRFFRAGASDDFNSFTISRANTTNCLLYNATEISGTSGQAGIVHTQNASAKLAFQAEL
jgi:hypothetical protein